MSVYGYAAAGGTRSYVADSPAGSHVEFTEHPSHAKLFADQAAVSAWLAARIATTFPVLGGTGTPALTATHAQNHGNRTE